MRSSEAILVRKPEIQARTRRSQERLTPHRFPMVKYLLCLTRSPTLELSSRRNSKLPFLTPELLLSIGKLPTARIISWRQPRRMVA